VNKFKSESKSKEGSKEKKMKSYEQHTYCRKERRANTREDEKK
jgi:hypothetical protein